MKWWALATAGTVPGLAILSLSPNMVVNVIGVVVLFVPIVWLFRQYHLRTRHLAQYYVLDASRDRFFFNVASAKRIAPALLLICFYNGLLEDNLVDVLGAAVVMIILSGFLGHFANKRYAWRLARKQNRGK